MMILGRGRTLEVCFGYEDKQIHGTVGMCLQAGVLASGKQAAPSSSCHCGSPSGTVLM